MKKVLIITYYWPPAGGPGVARVVKLVKYLPRYGWQPVVLTVAGGDFPAEDHSYDADVAPELPVYRVPALEPFKLYRRLLGLKPSEKIPTFVLNPSPNTSRREKLGRWLRANFFIPDARIGWYFPARKVGLTIIRKEQIDLIWASSPPHSLQLIARYLARQTGVKWVADFRDPWLEAFWQRDLPQLFWTRRINHLLERLVLNSADYLTTVSMGLQTLFTRKSRRPCRVIPNGYDPADFQQLPRRFKNDRFTIVYTGHLGKDQSLQPLIRALWKLPAKLARQVGFDFYGSCHAAIAAELQTITPYITLQTYPYRDHAQVLSAMWQADLLLLIIPATADNEGIVTGKLFEYLATGNYVLGIGPENGDAARIVKETGTGRVYDYQTDLSPVLEELIKKWQRDEKLTQPTAAVLDYSRVIQAERLAAVFAEVSR